MEITIFHNTALKYLKNLINLCRIVLNGIMANLQLSNIVLEEAFFESARLIAIRSSAPGYSLCGYMNEMLGFDFERATDYDISVDLSPRQSRSRSYSLFETLTETFVEQAHFPVFRYAYPGYETACALLYTNKSDGFTLLPDMPGVDYILYLPAEVYDDTTINLMGYLSRMSIIAWAKELELASVKWKKNLII